MLKFRYSNLSPISKYGCNSCCLFNTHFGLTLSYRFVMYSNIHIWSMNRHGISTLTIYFNVPSLLFVYQQIFQMIFTLRKTILLMIMSIWISCRFTLIKSFPVRLNIYLKYPFRHLIMHKTEVLITIESYTAL